mmetsp:Transcript_36120/g.34176  ORF Transcript_36120/g.34176 Transcript_36120/m.34176 type:complete len:357 (+) Transcript_36120:387-1457(+)|eukprot:CAMPEP_0119050016 /NCGR_PEP_ID=MMETSP1177-20130426/67784_1 /TAXON_ID=2985 /ORGANISM="Ochromonas sp, Strain CCMP1899" /LENGTH=356 /DNA_ID=CAMNT_0007027925 /DNA_START=274 /DNA_END=1344 /DNA_ORIENTATION=-
MESDPGVQASMIGFLRALGEGYRNQELTAEAISHFLRAIELSKRPYPPNLERFVLLELYDCHEALSRMYLNNDDIALAEPHSNEAFYLGEKVYSGENLAGNETEYAKGMVARAYFFCKKGDVQKGIAFYEKAYNCLTSVLDEEDKDVQEVIEDLIEAYTNAHNLIKARELLTCSLARFRSHGKASGIVYATRTHQLAKVCLNNRQLIEAETGEKEAIGIFEMFHSSFSLHYSEALNTIGKARVLQHKLDKETENYFLRAIEVDAANHKGNVSHVCSISSLAAFYYRQKDLPRALEHYEEALRILITHDDSTVDQSNLPEIISNIKAGKFLEVDGDGHSYIMEVMPYSPGYVIAQRA